VKRDTPLLAALAMTGLAALALEVLWSRAMIPWVGGTALSQIATVAIYMTGLFAGSAIAVRRLARIADPRRLFMRVEIAACLASLAAVLALPLADPLLSAFSQGSLLASGLGSVLRGLAGGGLMLPATILMGVSFPLAIAAIDRGQGARAIAAIASGNEIPIRVVAGSMSPPPTLDCGSGSMCSNGASCGGPGYMCQFVPSCFCGGQPFCICTNTTFTTCTSLICSSTTTSLP